VEVAVAAQLVDAHVGTILSSVGFADAVVGADQDRAQVLYHADMETVVGLLPCLPDGYDGQAPSGACFDVMVELRADRLTDVNMDGGSLDAALELFDMTNLAAALRGVLGSPAQVAAPVVANGLKALFVDYPRRNPPEVLWAIPSAAHRHRPWVLVANPIVPH
jgi:hypothetical protein